MKKKTTKCDCVKRVNKQLDPQGLELDDRMVMSLGKGSASGTIEAPLILLRYQNGKRTKTAPPMFCAYCPFCGKKKAQP